MSRKSLTQLGSYIVDNAQKLTERNNIKFYEKNIANAFGMSQSQFSMFIHDGKYHRHPDYSFIVKYVCIIAGNAQDLNSLEQLLIDELGGYLPVCLSTVRAVDRLIAEMTDLASLPDEERINIINNTLKTIFPGCEPIIYQLV